MIFFIGEACAGFYLGDGVNPPDNEMYMHRWGEGEEPEGLNVAFDGYVQLMYYARGWLYWQNVIMGLQGKSDYGKTERFKSELPLVFPDFKWEEFVSLYESVKLR